VAIRGTGRSAWTHWKDEHVPLVGQKILAVSLNTLRRRAGFERLVVVDLTAGCGVEPDGRVSIVTRVLDWAAARALPVDAYLCEADRSRHHQLDVAMAARFPTGQSVRVSTFRGDCQGHVPAIIADITAGVRHRRKAAQDVYGLILADPCGFAPWSAAHGLSASFPRLDVLMYLGAATIKWLRPSLGVPTLGEQVARFGKREVYISPPHGNYQWVALLLSNFPYGRSETHHMESITSEVGRSWYERATTTRAERQALYQPALWADVSEAEGVI
jgi:hypothetical protein